MQKHIIIVDDEWFLKNLKIFTNTDHCKVSRSFIEDDLFKDDSIHKELMSKKKKASDAFYNYEFDIRTKHKKQLSIWERII